MIGIAGGAKALLAFDSALRVFVALFDEGEKSSQRMRVSATPSAMRTMLSGEAKSFELPAHIDR